MRTRRPAWILAVLLLLSSCGGQEVRREEPDTYPEPYHLREPVDEAMMPRVEGIKACFDAWAEAEDFPLTGEVSFYIKHPFSASDPGEIILLGYDDAGNGLTMLSQHPPLDGYELYACSYGTYDARTEVFAVAKVGVGFFYELESGLVIPSMIDGEENPEYAELHEQWRTLKNGG